jgi:hypothetical protein
MNGHPDNVLLEIPLTTQFQSFKIRVQVCIGHFEWSIGKEQRIRVADQATSFGYHATIHEKPNHGAVRDSLGLLLRPRKLSLAV